MTKGGGILRPARTLAALCLGLAVCGVGYLGFRAGHADFRYRFFAEMSNTQDRIPVVLKSAAGFTKTYALYGQDLWLLHYIYPGVADGFFVDLGSADGEADSNTKLLESTGWRGICIDPFPSNMQDRTCRLFEEVVDSEAGRKVKFQQPGSFSGGILDYAGWWVNSNARDKAVEVTTETLADILRRANAPSFINYMNVDIEGAEYEALRTFPFDVYQIGALTVEHNDDRERRMAIRRLLENHGYVLERAILDQDWYVRRELPLQSPRGGN